MAFKKARTYRATAVDETGKETVLTGTSMSELYLTIIKWAGVSVEHDFKRTSAGYGVMTGLLVRKED